VEGLFLARTPGRDWDAPAGRIAIQNVLRTLGGLKGLPYWSASRNREMTLFNDSYAVDSPSGLRRTADPLVASITDRETVYGIQDDTTFGKNLYEFTYRTDAEAVSLQVENVNALSLLFVPVVPPRGMGSRFLVVTSGDTVAVWGACWLRAAFRFMEGGDRESSLVNRLTALSRWFLASLRRETLDPGSDRR
jgi:hypothetical protein